MDLQRLQERRARLGITQGALATAMGSNHSQISRVESGREQPSAEWLARYSSALDALERARARESTPGQLELLIDRLVEEQVEATITAMLCSLERSGSIGASTVTDPPTLPEALVHELETMVAARLDTEIGAMASRLVDEALAPPAVPSPIEACYTIDLYSIWTHLAPVNLEQHARTAVQHLCARLQPEFDRRSIPVQVSPSAAPARPTCGPWLPLVDAIAADMCQSGACWPSILDSHRNPVRWPSLAPIAPLALEAGRRPWQSQPDPPAGTAPPWEKNPDVDIYGNIITAPAAAEEHRHAA